MVGFIPSMKMLPPNDFSSFSSPIILEYWMLENFGRHVLKEA
jgi:hypothetical protein